MEMRFDKIKFTVYFHKKAIKRIALIAAKGEKAKRFERYKHFFFYLDVLLHFGVLLIKRVHDSKVFVIAIIRSHVGCRN